MNDDTMFNRNAQTWLELGPTAAPRRAVETARTAIHAAPQQRALRIPWRLPEMTQPTRLMAAAVGVIAVVLAGAVLLQRQQSQIGTPSPTPTMGTPSPIPSPLSAGAVQSMWASGGSTSVGSTGLPTFLWASVGTRPFPNFNPAPANWAMNVDSTSLRLEGSSGDVSSTFNSLDGTGNFDLRLDTAQQDLDKNHWSCQTGDLGTYSLQLSSDNQTASLTSARDSCPEREAILVGDWTRWDCTSWYGGYAYCPHKDVLASGRHVASVFKPFDGGASGQFAWTTLGDGWITLSKPPTWPQETTVSSMWLYRRGATNSGLSVVQAIGVFSDLVPSPARAVPTNSGPEATCSDGLPALGRTAADVATWFDSLPYLSVSNRTGVTVGGLHGVQMDVALLRGFVDPCASSSPPASGYVQSAHEIQLFAGAANTSEGIYLAPDDVPNGPTSDSSARFIVLDTGEVNRVLVIEVPSPDDNSPLEVMLATAMPVIQSMEFIP